MQQLKEEKKWEKNWEIIPFNWSLKWSGKWEVHIKNIIWLEFNLEYNLLIF